MIAMSCCVVCHLQLMSFPGSDAAQAEAPGAKGGGGGKVEEEVAPIGSVFAVLQAYATHVFAPTVRAYAATRGGDDKVSGVSNRTLSEDFPSHLPSSSDRPDTTGPERVH